MEGRGHVHVGLFFVLSVIAADTIKGYVMRWAGTRWPNNPAIQGFIALH